MLNHAAEPVVGRGSTPHAVPHMRVTLAATGAATASVTAAAAAISGHDASGRISRTYGEHGLLQVVIETRDVP